MHDRHRGNKQCVVLVFVRSILVPTSDARRRSTVAPSCLLSIVHASRHALSPTHVVNFHFFCCGLVVERFRRCARLCSSRKYVTRRFPRKRGYEYVFQGFDVKAFALDFLSSGKRVVSSDKLSTRLSRFLHRPKVSHLGHIIDSHLVLYLVDLSGPDVS